MVSSKDFSAFALFTAGFATLTSAFAVAVGPVPIGNPFSFPEAGQSVQVGVPFEVTWQPTNVEDGPVTIYICKGPSTNCVNDPTPIAVSIPNTGRFSWTPALGLLPTNGQGYGLQLVIDSTGQYQYTSQFGISNPNAGPTIIVSSNTAVPTVVAPTAIISEVHPPVVTSVWAPTGTGAIPTSIVQPTGGMSVPPTLIKTTSHPSAPTTTPPPFTGAASKTTVGFGAVFGLVLAAFAL